MHALASRRLSRSFAFLIPALFLAGCFGEGEGQERTFNQPAPPEPPVPPGFCDPVNFEPQCPADTFTNFEGGIITAENISDLPDEVAAGNDSFAVGRMLKFRADSGLTFGGSTINLTVPFTGVQPGSSWTMEVYATRSVRVLLQPEPQGPGTGVEVTHGGTGWETLTFAMPALSGTVSGLTLIFDNGVLGDAQNDPDNWTFYFDDITLVEGGGGGPGPGDVPTISAPTPTQDPANVISLYSDAYTDIAVTWPTDFSVPNNTTSDITVDGGLVKEHLNLSFVGIEFASLDVSGMTHFHIDIWTPNADGLLLKLVDFGGDGFGGGNDTEGPLTFDADSTPPLSQGTWVSLDIPLSDMQAAGLGSLTDINQLVLDAIPDGTAIYVDNVYFYNDAGGGGTAPTTSAPTPTQDAADVISLFSDAYTDVATTWPTSWSEPNNTTSDVTIDGGLVKEHLAINFVGVEFQVDATSMTHIHFDVWTPDADSLLLRLVDFGGDGFGGGNDTSGEVILDNASTPALTQGSWVSVDILLSDLQAAGLASLADLNQIVIDPTEDGSTVYVDNVYFYDAAGGGGGNAPTTSAPTPTQDPASVISLYSDAYTDIAVTWPTPWSEPDPSTVTDVTIDGGLVKEHLAINFVGVEFQVDGTSMTHLHLDVWTPDADSLLVRLVDFGGDGFGGGNDTNGDVILDNASMPELVQGSWVSVDIPLATFQAAGLASLADLNQIVLDPTEDGSTVYVDNVYFYSDVAPTAPTTSAPTPTQDAADVISLYSDAYTDIAVTWPTPWSEPDPSTVTDVTIDGGLVKEHLAVNFVGVEFQVDGTTMTHLHLDVWTADADSLLVRLVDFGGDGFGGGNDTNGDVILDGTSTPELVQGSWVSVDIPLATFQAAGLASLADLNQIVLDPTEDGSTVYIDNVYFYNDAAAGGGSFVNGDFEANGGSLDGWTLTLVDDVGGGLGSIAADNSGQGGRAGTVARLSVTGSAASFNDAVISQEGLAQGTVMAGDTITITFDLYGTVTQPGAATFVEVIFLDANGQDVGGRDFLNSDPTPYTATTAWTPYSGTVTAGTAFGGAAFDVSGGVVLSLKVSCGPVDGCAQDVSFDNVTFTVN